LIVDMANILVSMFDSGPG